MTPDDYAAWLALLRDDAYAATFQSIGQYRHALIARAKRMHDQSLDRLIAGLSPAPANCQDGTGGHEPSPWLTNSWRGSSARSQPISALRSAIERIPMQPAVPGL